MQKTLKKYFAVFLLPTVIAFSIAFIIPFITGLYLSFCNFTTVSNAKFVGLQNYITAFEPSQTFKDDFGAALLEYANGNMKWDDVKKLVVDEWASEKEAAK